ncbi:MAG: hypothetical protein AABW49_00095 [Nanoarchaeota archaeon]
MIELCIPLYGPAREDLNIESNFVDPQKIEELSFFLLYHLHRVAYTVKILQNSGWVLVDNKEMSMLVYIHEVINDKEAAEKELSRLEIPLDLVEVYEINNFK